MGVFRDNLLLSDSKYSGYQLANVINEMKNKFGLNDERFQSIWDNIESIHPSKTVINFNQFEFQDDFNVTDHKIIANSNFSNDFEIFLRKYKNSTHDETKELLNKNMYLLDYFDSYNL